METNFYQNLLEEEKRLSKLLDAIGVLKKNYEHDSVPAVSIAHNSKQPDATEKPYFEAAAHIPEKYSKDLTQIQKTIYFLKKIGHGVKDDIAKEYLNAGDEKKSLEELIGIVGYHCSRFNRLNLINAKKIGNKNMYSLKKD